MAGKMKAAWYEAFGDTGVIKTGELDIPGLKEAEVLVKVKAAAVNPVDAAVRKGLLKGLPVVFPAIPGWDMTGIIEERGFGARRFNAGDEVYAYARRPIVQWGMLRPVYSDTGKLSGSSPSNAFLGRNSRYSSGRANGLSIFICGRAFAPGTNRVDPWGFGWGRHPGDSAGHSKRR